MFDTITSEMLVSGGLLGVSALVFAGSVMMMRAPREKRSDVDIDAVVRNAPYDRLHNVIPLKG